MMNGRVTRELDIIFFATRYLVFILLCIRIAKFNSPCRAWANAPQHTVSPLHRDFIQDDECDSKRSMQFTRTMLRTTFSIRGQLQGCQRVVALLNGHQVRFWQRVVLFQENIL